MISEFDFIIRGKALLFELMLRNNSIPNQLVSSFQQLLHTDHNEIYMSLVVGGVDSCCQDISQ